ncbi:hypothetical protein ZIOFF_056870 [Zingiber officinale]|uniref:ACT domain-containing protein n=1 Tax=Zingiber officinale TaxID=94328 RepID=A0A8J5FHH2_ZINOF|nr:hypothetical protein ZIOFF_056870 [Zingiber officinale]
MGGCYGCLCRLLGGGDEAETTHLRSLPSASNRLRLFQINLLDPHSILAAIRGVSGCSTSPRLASSLASRIPRELIDPAVTGTLNVLHAAKESGVRRVVVTSSISAIVPSPRWPTDQVKDESCWTDLDYCRQKELEDPLGVLESWSSSQSPCEFAGVHCDIDCGQVVGISLRNISYTHLSIDFRFDNLKVTYLNTVLATMPLGNFYRSPNMGESIDFCIHVATPVEKIAIMRERILGIVPTSDPLYNISNATNQTLFASIWRTRRSTASLVEKSRLKPQERMSVLSEALSSELAMERTLFHQGGDGISTKRSDYSFQVKLVKNLDFETYLFLIINNLDNLLKKIERQKDLDNIKECIQKSIGEGSSAVPSRRRYVDLKPSSNHTSIELTGTDRPGLLSEVSVVLTDLKCNVVSAEVWTQNTRAAVVMQVNDEMNSAITDPQRLFRIKQLLFNWFWQGLFCGHNTV